MKALYSWLSDYLETPPATREIVERMPVTGTEVEGWHLRGLRSIDDGVNFRVGKVLTCEQHPNADRLSVCSVDVGDGAARQIVCGAPNVRAGLTVAVALPGARMPDGVVLGEAKLRGVESSGMLLSERELQLSDSHAGIMELDEAIPAGAPLAEHVPLHDAVIEFEVTSNRPDCLGMHGLAREVAASFGTQVTPVVSGDLPPAAARSVTEVVSVDVQAPDLCPRYMARAFDGVVVGESPLWLRSRLTAAGMRPINTVVDVTNYVMLTTGQPLHAFDAQRIAGKKLIVRRATAGERVVTLDDVERQLTPEMLVIADNDKVNVIAGVLGAADAEVDATTTSLVLESATFDGPTLLRTSQALGVRSEASGRFEKGLDPWLPETALELATQLLVQICGATVLSGTIDERADDIAQPPIIEFDPALCDAILGIDVPRHEMVAVLERLGYSVARASEQAWQVTVPHWRMLDTTRPIDLVEEIVRIYGLQHIPATLPARPGAGGLDRGQRLQRAVEDALVALGFRECVTYSLVEDGYGARFSGDTAPVRVDHPMSAEHVELRTTLLGSLLDVVRTNQAVGNDDMAAFEIAHTYAAAGDGGAVERDVLCMVAAGNRGGGSGVYGAGQPSDLPALTGMLTTLLAPFGFSVHLHAAQREGLHPGRSAELRVRSAEGEHSIGWAGEVHPSLLEEMDLDAPVAAAEIDLARLLDAQTASAVFEPISDFPPVRQDLAVVVSTDVAAQDLVDAVLESGGDLLESASVFDRYVGPGIDEGYCSLALRLTFRSHERTLTDEDIVPVRERIVGAVAERFAARLR